MREAVQQVAIPLARISRQKSYNRFLDSLHAFLGREAVQQGRTATVQQICTTNLHRFRGADLREAVQQVVVPLARISRQKSYSKFLDSLHTFLGSRTAAFKAVIWHENREICTAFIVVPILLFACFLRRWLSTEKEISCKSLFADYLFC